MTRPLRVFLACTGLGRERRGFETFTRSCARALAGEPSLDLHVFAGGRDEHRPGERVVANLPRRSRGARVLGRVFRRDPYFVEQGSFFLGFLPALVNGSPDVVYYADLNFGNACWHWRRITGARYRLLFYNGGNTTMPYTRCDHVQQLTPAALDAADARGEPRERQTLLPHGVELPETFTPADAASRRRAREALGLPLDGELLLSVGQLDRATKRTDLLIEGVASLAKSRPYLLLAGADGPDGERLRALATARLGTHWGWRTVPWSQMRLVYAAADRFALLSRGEGFGLAYAEALAAGLPVLAHDDATTRYVVGAAGLLRRMTDVTSVRAALAALGEMPLDAGAQRGRHASARGRFSWERLRSSYVSLFHAVAAGAR